MPAIILLLQALAAFAPQIPEILLAVETAIALMKSGAAAPTTEQQATFDAALLAAHNALQAA
jgi:hypothetical protein